MSQPEPSSNLVVLKGCGDSAEAAMVRSLLDAHGIACVVQGENHRAMLGAVMGGYIEVNVLVASEDLERAQALLEASTDAPEHARSASPGAADSDEAVCPVHGQRSTATCARCGTFLCPECDAQGAQGSPLCEDCAERKVAGGETRRNTRRRLAAWAVLLFLFGPVIFMTLAALMQRILG